MPELYFLSVTFDRQFVRTIEDSSLLIVFVFLRVVNPSNGLQATETLHGLGYFP